MSPSLVVPRLARIVIYPIKSLDGVEVPQITVLESGVLAWDRAFAIFDNHGRFVNGKRNPKVHSLKTSFNFSEGTVYFQVRGKDEVEGFQLQESNQELENWLSYYFDEPVFFRQNAVTGFPDDTEASGPTLISTATLETVASWFPRISVAEMRSRLRTNLEINSVPAFWEDRLFSHPGAIVEFQLGDVCIYGINPCQRCIVPTRNPLTGEVYPNFQKIFAAKRQATLPDWVNPLRFNHYFRLAVNTKILESEARKKLAIGDSLQVLGICPLREILG